MVVKAKKFSSKHVKLVGGKKKKKKQTLKFNIECKNPCEDGIMNINDFVSNEIYLYLLKDHSDHLLIY